LFLLLLLDSDKRRRNKPLEVENQSILRHQRNNQKKNTDIHWKRTKKRIEMGGHVDVINRERKRD